MLACDVSNTVRGSSDGGKYVHDMCKWKYPSLEGVIIYRNNEEDDDGDDDDDDTDWGITSVLSKTYEDGVAKLSTFSQYISQLHLCISISSSRVAKNSDIIFNSILILWCALSLFGIERVNDTRPILCMQMKSFIIRYVLWYSSRYDHSHFFSRFITSSLLFYTIERPD